MVFEVMLRDRCEANSERSVHRGGFWTSGQRDMWKTFSIYALLRHDLRHDWRAELASRVMGNLQVASLLGAMHLVASSSI